MRDLTAVDGLEPQLGLLLAMLDDGTREWRGEIGDVPEDAVVWQPFPGGHSIGAVILHMADAELYWVQEIAAGQPVSADDEARLLSKQTDQYAVRWPTPPARPLAWYFQQRDEVRARTHQIVRKLGDPGHLGARGDRRYTLRWILHHVIGHEAYHGGQAVLLSLMHPAARQRRGM
jgi:uncharacterized damage-inducible protein DinB